MLVSIQSFQHQEKLAWNYIDGQKMIICGNTFLIQAMQRLLCYSVATLFCSYFVMLVIIILDDFQYFKKFNNIIDFFDMQICRASYETIAGAQFCNF